MFNDDNNQLSTISIPTHSLMKSNQNMLGFTTENRRRPRRLLGGIVVTVFMRFLGFRNMINYGLKVYLLLL